MLSGAERRFAVGCMRIAENFGPASVVETVSRSSWRDCTLGQVPREIIKCRKWKPNDFHQNCVSTTYSDESNQILDELIVEMGSKYGTRAALLRIVSSLIHCSS